KSLWSDKSFKDFVLRVDWRMKTDEPGHIWKVPLLEPDGSTKKDADGKEVKKEVEDIDSGIYVRGSEKSQINIWRWPAGSGEVWGYGTEAKRRPGGGAGGRPKENADKPRGEWNTFEITMKGDRLSVKLNDKEVISNAQLPGVPAEGPIGLQHHGSFNKKTGK